ncbi:hypothetical protein OV079_22380 [Nannocystis pusilla]|uniref:Uncharacterized protein n=1 Tax=Nannocystis pusilla TaxID=889268 RepID=A0A9X3EYF0_9BACT|nr:hypothetical protein [Nannocystis pusilla]MCY1008256.1 hypothetical protein [Nannocystis pusilla]
MRDLGVIDGADDERVEAGLDLDAEAAVGGERAADDRGRGAVALEGEAGGAQGEPSWARKRPPTLLGAGAGAGVDRGVVVAMAGDGAEGAGGSAAAPQAASTNNQGRIPTRMKAKASTPRRREPRCPPVRKIGVSV